MAIDKRKILQSAQKHMQKGALDKALKDFMTVLKADPKDVNVRLKVGDIHLKQGNTEDAVAAYDKVAQRFMKDGFDAKAVALYKQITKIDPKRISIYEPLAELYQRLGLTSDAMAALQTAADAQYRAGAKTEALDLLRKMASLDPSNTTSRLKVADLLRQEGRTEEAISELREVAQELERQGSHEERARVLGRVLELDPKHRETLEVLGRLRLESGDHAGAEELTLGFLEQHPDELAAYQLLADVVEAAGRIGSHVAHFRKMVEILKGRGEDGEARTIMQRFVTSGGFGGEASDDPVLETDEEIALDAGAAPRDLGSDAPEFTDPGYAGEEGLRIGESIDGLGEESDTAEASGRGASLPPLPKLDLEETDPEDASDDSGLLDDDSGLAEDSEVSEVSEVSDLSTAEGSDTREADASGEPFDPDQVLAEAGVYLRYGKHDRAVETLRGVLAKVPGHLGALHKLGEALEATGDPDNALRAYQRAAEGAQAEGDTRLLETLRERVAALDPAAAEALAPASGGAAESADPDPTGVETLESGDGIEFEIDLDEASDAGESPAAGSQAPPSAEETTEESEISLDLGEAGFDLEADTAESGAGDATEEEELRFEDEPTGDPGGAPDPGQTATFDGSGELELELEEESPPPAAASGAPAAADEDDAGRSASSSTTPAQIVEELEEAEFYFQQGMYAEARGIYTRVLEVAPSHPQALLRLGEIDASSGSGHAAPPEEAGGDDEEFAVPGEGFEDLSFDDDDEDSTADVAVGAAGGAEQTAPFEGREADRAEAPAVETEAPEASDPAPAEVAPAPRAAAEPEPEPLATSGPGGDFDLAAELSDAFHEDDPLGESGTRRAHPGRGTTEEEGFEQVFAAFKAGVKNELGEGDYEAHYDLGIAYKEMGLLEDAIGEFGTAVASEAHRLPCLHMMSLCALDLGRASDAVAHLEQALSIPEVPEGQQVALRFDLGRAYAIHGDTDRARAAFEAVRAIDPEFRDVDAELEALAAGQTPPSAEASEEEAFESFDDLMAEAGAEDAEPAQEAAPAYESFDDLMEDDTEPPADDAPAEASPEPAEPAAPEPDDSAKDEGPEKPGRRRRKKISFV